MLPVAFGKILLQHRIHAFTFWVFIIFRIIKTTDAHSGYNFPISPLRVFPFLGDNGAHEYHHFYNKGNYGSFFWFWDTLCGTNGHFNAHLKKVS